MYKNATWTGTKEKLQHYRRREPEKTKLYQLVYHGRDELPRVWEDRFQSTYGVLRDEVLITFDEYLNCGLLCHGGARAYCDSCKHSVIIGFSCKKRGVCPSCAAKRAVKFAEHLFEEVLEEVPHKHVVFTIPKRLRAYLRYDRRLYTLLCRAAWQSIKETLSCYRGTPAIVLNVQTAGEALNYHPHLHGLCAGGVFMEDGTFVLVEIDQEALTRHFENYLLSAFVAKELITDEVVREILSQSHSGFNVWVGEPFTDKESSLFVARYVERGPLSLEKLAIQDDIISYTTTDGTAHQFDALEFLALLSSHVPCPYEHKGFIKHWLLRY